MNNNLLEKHKNDPAWAEVIRLYSGLFDTQDEREDFILDLAETDILLAAECKTSSVEGEKKLFNNILNKSKMIANNLSQSEISVQGVLSLIELNKYDEALNIISTKKSNKLHKELIKKIMENLDSNSGLNFLLFLINYIERKKNKSILFIWAVELFYHDLNITHKNKLGMEIK